MPERWIKGRKAAAAELGIAASTLREWMKDPDFPDCSGKRGHPIEAILDWRDQRAKKGSIDQQSMGLIKLAREREQLEHDKIKTERELINLELQRGELYPRPAVELVLSTFFTLYADGCEQMINTLPSVAAVPKKYQASLRKQLRTEVETLSTQLRESIAAELLKLKEAAEQAGKKTK